jgi:membrane-bound lytic murein transglycosylase A
MPSNKTLSVALLCVVLAACAPLPKQATTEPQAVKDLPGWQAEDFAGLHEAMTLQCVSVAASPQRFPAFWPALCKSLPAAPNAGQMKLWLEDRFRARMQYGAAEAGAAPSVFGTLTGYYEPLVHANRQPGGAYQFPIYRRPNDLLSIDMAAVFPNLRNQRVRGRLESSTGQTSATRVVPYFSRADIETTGVLKGQELLWLNDRADGFFLEIQGSGRAQLPDGSIVRVGYADQNGHPYRPIGRLLIDTGAIPREQMSALAIKDWIRKNPEQATPVLHSNASLVFFRELPMTEAQKARPELGPPGSLGVPLSPMRSIAVDPRQIPLGSLVWVFSEDRKIHRLALAQDTGGAINGPIRADLFTGFGPQAEQLASGLNARLQLFVLNFLPN